MKIVPNMIYGFDQIIRMGRAHSASITVGIENVLVDGHEMRRMDRSDATTLADRTWQEVDAAIESGRTTVIVPIGATEQHGPHLPLRTDVAIGEAIAERLAARLEGALVGPPIPFGPSDEHDAFPGTVSISPRTLRSLLEEYVESLERSGFERIVLLPSHGGNFSVVATVAPELARSVDADVVAIDDLNRHLELLNEGLDRSAVEHREPVVHAGAIETAILLAVDPDAVRTDRASEGFDGTVSASVLYRDGIDAYSPNGILGDARPATADVGEVILEHVVNAYATDVRDEFAALDSSDR